MSVNDDYTGTDWLFKLRKVARYTRLYGVLRTLVKIKGQFHMKAVVGFDGARWMNPGCRTPDAPERNVAIIGCGNFAFSNIAYYLSKYNRSFLRVACDMHPSRAASLCKAYAGAYAVADWKDIVADPLVKTVFIAANHASHAEYAVACIEAGKHVHIEKPHVVSQEQLDRLVLAMRTHPRSKVFLGFNRPRAPLFRRLQEMLAQESGTLMINWFVVGHQIERGHWYFDDKEGGRVLGNLCHWTDLTLHLVSLEKAFPCTIVSGSPPGAKSDFLVSVVFADRSCASITFSAKGHTFEGVREVLNIHKGNLLASLSDFEVLKVDVGEKKSRVSLLHRDHGHRVNILNSASAEAGEDIAYVVATARFFLAVRQAIDSGQPVEVSMADFRSPEPMQNGY